MKIVNVRLLTLFWPFKLENSIPKKTFENKEWIVSNSIIFIFGQFNELRNVRNEDRQLDCKPLVNMIGTRVSYY